MTHISEIVDRIMPYLDKEAIWREVAKRLVDVPTEDPYAAQSFRTDQFLPERMAKDLEFISKLTPREVTELAFGTGMGMSRSPEPEESTVSAIQESPHEQFDRFISECCELGHDQAASSRELWDAYLAWAEPSSDPDCGLSRTMFSRMVSQLDGVAKFKDRKLGGRMAFRGIGLKEGGDE